MLTLGDITAPQVWPFPEPSVVMDPLGLIKNSIKNMYFSSEKASDTNSQEAKMRIENHPSYLVEWKALRLFKGLRSSHHEPHGVHQGRGDEDMRRESF